MTRTDIESAEPTTEPSRGGRRRFGRLTAVVAAIVVAAGAGWFLVEGKDEAVATDEVTGGVATAEVSATDLAKVSRTRVFFGHQSVGYNVLDGVAAVYRAHSVDAPPIEERRDTPAASGGFVVHALIGENTKPLDKIKDFDALIRGGIGGQVDVAMMKFCYIDIDPGTDVDAVFAAYRDTLAALERDFPNVAFVKATVPLTTQPGRLSQLKQWVQGNDLYGATANATRERLNQLIRKEYGGSHLFDVAAVESAAPDGTRAGGVTDGRPYFALNDAFAADSGHLNAAGAQRAAGAWLSAVAQASSK
ncbi:hypothetical protein [Catellatospora citrea]|uniref:GDSL-like lipase/acylhydrolase family protein n=1 Tax=Catellatospora citrea TaxID=53366 RepID=A0A8J3KMA3_9ACTN|nr:hypothetical protein [Catellatospora citrea]RKE09672.1 hypothetical protein C8E86_4562 [Catellatospora citrea]GIG02713.1 hypothetical protein Cci01nite_78060 [Catellatospora citrea]